jgi:polygalacturonase
VAKGESRRSFLLRAGLLAGPYLVPGIAWGGDGAEVDVRAHGARGDGRADDTRAIQSAIDHAARSRGTVRVPAGEYVAGTLHLRSHLTVYLDAGASLIASRRDDAFDAPEPRRPRPVADSETADHRFALLQGRGIEAITLVGPGRIDGNRRSRAGPKPIALRECRNVRIRDLTIDNAGNYAVALLGCDDVEIVGLVVRNGYSDGIDPDCCRRVRIAGCRIDSRDDAICLKTSLALGVRRPTEDVTVTGCHLTTHHNALKLGTESSGDFRDIVLRDCTIVGRRHPWKGDLSSGIALETVDGAVLERVAVSGIRMDGVRAPIFVRLGQRGRGQTVPAAGRLTDVSISSVVATGATLASSITAVPGHAVRGISLSDVRVMSVGGGAPELASRPVPEHARRYPDATMFHELPAHGLYCRRVVGLRLQGIELAVERADARPAVVLQDVRDADVSAVRVAAPPASGGWAADGTLTTVQDTATSAVVRVTGRDSARIRLGESVHRAHDTAVSVAPDVPAVAVRLDGVSSTR